MITLSRSSLILCLLVVAFFAGATSSQEKAKGLTKEDEKLLESLLRDFLFDPRGAERVEVKVVEAGPAGLRLPPREETRVGWLVKDKVEGGKAGHRVYFTDGANLPAPAKDKSRKLISWARAGSFLPIWNGPRRRRRTFLRFGGIGGF